LVYTKGKSLANTWLVLYVLKRDDGVQRFGFSINRKCGKAVIRNKAKRHLRELCRSKIVEIQGGFDAIFVARSRIRKASWNELSVAMDDLLRRSRLLNKEMQGSMDAQDD
jgi:ribonuclease P protein component